MVSYEVLEIVGMFEHRGSQSIFHFDDGGLKNNGDKAIVI